MKRIIIFCICAGTSTGAIGQSSADIKNIDNLCGCFEVQFQYAETFAPDEEYPYHNRERISNVLELVLPVEKSKKKIVLQHLLIVGNKMVIKHWREDWSFENPVLFQYTGDNVWEKQQLSRNKVKNKWTQTVWEVSDAPRYQGVSEWVRTDNKTFWLNTTDAPLPRREYTKRKDYNILKRRNMIIVDENGWIHDQDNQKIMRGDGKDSLIAEEKGINSYRRVEDSKCEEARLHWQKNKNYWTLVRNIWEEYLHHHTTVTVKSTVEGKPLHEYLGDIEEQVANKKIELKEVEARIRSALGLFVSDKVIAAK